MYQAGRAILLQLWRRHHWGLSADLVYLAIAPAIVALVPLDAGKKPVADVLGGILGVVVLAHLVGVFAYGFEADLVKRESGYPARAFVLPVSNWALTIWPAIGGAAALVVAWLTLALGVLRPGGHATPLWWPGLALSALLSISQAIGWTPFSHHWLRSVLAVATASVIAAMGAVATILFADNELLVVGTFFVVWTLCFSAAYVGVGRARRGEPVTWRWLDRLGSRLATSSAAREAFRSPLRAQLWFEMRRHGWTMPIFVATVLVCVLPVLLVRSGPAVPAWRILAIVASLPPLLAGIVALGFGKADPFQRGVMLPQFMATRPLTCARFVAAKMLAAALTVLISCGMVLAVMLPWFFRSDNQQSLSAVWQGLPTWKVAVVATLAIIGWIALSWRQLAASIWVALTGREWVGTVISFAFASLLIFWLVVGLWLCFHPDHLDQVPSFLPWCLAVMLLAKIAAGSWCTRQLLSRRLMTTGTVGTILIIWCAVVAALCRAMVWLAPAGVSIAQLICGAVVLVPFARLAGTPLALAFNRHR